MTVVGRGTWHDRLSPAEVHEVKQLARAAVEADGVSPLSEDGRFQLEDGAKPGVAHLLVRAPDGTLAGYARLDSRDLGSGPGGELVVAPAWRRQGVGAKLVAELGERAPGRLRLWAHGTRPGARALAVGSGFHQTRVLWQMTRSLSEPLAEPRWQPGVHVRTFEPGRDEDAWVALNARAFAAHPEQGRWTVQDLLHREAKPWFDPPGFFLAERRDRPEARLVGFHWTKVTGQPPAAGRPPAGVRVERVMAAGSTGEVYVVGVDPAEAGHGLGEALTLHGLRYLRDRGMGRAVLYVDEDNRRAMALYERLGFTRSYADVTFTRDG